MQPVLEEWPQQGMCLGRQHTHADVQPVPKNESEVPLQSVDGNNEEVG